MSVIRGRPGIRCAGESIQVGTLKSPAARARPLHFPTPLLRALRAGKLRISVIDEPLAGRPLHRIRDGLECLPRALGQGVRHAYLHGEHAAQQRAHAGDARWDDLAKRRRLPAQREALLLACVGRDRFGRRHWLLPAARRALDRLLAAAAKDAIELQPVSSFRSVAAQLRIVERKHRNGQSWEEIFAVNAPPGYSEHHSGRAIDLAQSGQPVLTEAFELTAAFAWLCRHAADFGFRLSYPRDNPHGYVYEPWHWYYMGVAEPEQRQKFGTRRTFKEPRKKI